MNFLPAGSIIGKVGDVVGQSYHAERYIRSYVRTPNPNTPAQQNSRALFTTALSLAQQAIAANPGAACWVRPGRSPWQWRVSTALNRLRRGLSPSAALPLFPDGYNEPIQIVGFHLVSPGTPGNGDLVADFPVLPKSRTFSFTALVVNISNGYLTKFSWLDTIPAGGTWRSAFPNYSDYRFSARSWIMSQTVDDNAHGGSSFAVPRFSYRSSLSLRSTGGVSP